MIFQKVVQELLILDLNLQLLKQIWSKDLTATILPDGKYFT